MRTYITNITKGKQRRVALAIAAVLEQLEQRTLLAATPPAPTGISLDPLYDTGVSNSDGITALDNSSAAKSLRFSVSGTTAGNEVRVYADGVQIATASAADGATVVSTDGTTALSQAVHLITAKQHNGKLSAESPGLSITVDTIAPANPIISLQTGSDTGISQTDAITSDRTPTFDVTVSEAGTLRITDGFAKLSPESHPVSAGVNAITLGESADVLALRSLLLDQYGATDPVVGDFNRDGNRDVALLNVDTRQLSISFGNGDGTFGAATYAALPGLTNAYHLNGGDFDADGTPDLVVSGSGGTLVLRDVGDGSFVQSQLISQTVVYPGQRMVPADIDGDHRLDLVIPANTTGVVAVLRNVGACQFSTSPASITIPTSVRSVSTADFNGDGRDDVVITSYSPGVYLALGQADGNLSTPTQISTLQSNYLGLGDFDGDGRTDVAMAAQPSSHISILPGNGDGTFGTPGEFSSLAVYSELTLADFDSDGKLDIACYTSQRGDTILFGNGDFTSSRDQRYSGVFLAQYFASGDFDADGLPDIVATSPNADAMAVMTHASGIADATYSLSFALEDLAGNVRSVVWSPLLEIRSNPPKLGTAYLASGSDTGMSSMDGITNADPITLKASGYIANGVSVGYFQDNLGNQLAASQDTNGAWQAVVSGVVEGVYTYRLHVTDAAGNSTTNSQFTVTVDRTAPAPLDPILSAGSDTGTLGDWITSQNMPTITTAGGSRYRLIVDGTQIGEFAAGYSKVLSTLADGPHTITVVAVDAAGNAAEARSRTLIIDTVAPGAPTLAMQAASDTGLSNSDRITNDATPTFDLGSITEKYRVYLNSTLVYTGDFTQPAWTSSALVDGAYTLRIQTFDDAGHVASPDATLTFTIDTATPAVPTLSLRAADDSGISASDGITKVTNPLLQLSTTNYFIIQQDGVDLSGAYTNGSSYQLSGLANGTYTYTARITDVAGNTVATSPLGLTIDTLAPTAPASLDLDDASDNGISNTDNLTNIRMPRFAFSAAPYFRLYSGASLLSGGYASGSSFTTLTQSDGLHTYGISTIDAAGNESVKATLDVTIDTAAPAVPVIDLPAEYDKRGNNTDNITSLRDFIVTVAGGPYLRLLRQGLPAGDAYGTQTQFVEANLADGSYTYQAFARDAAGNESSGASLTVTVDTTIPVPFAPVLQASSDSGISSSDRITNDVTPTFAAVLDYEFRVYVDGSLVSAYLPAGTEYTSDALTDGAHQIAYQYKDGDAESVVGTPLTITIDAIAPAAPGAPDLDAASDLGISPTDNVTRDNTPTFLFPESSRLRIYRDGLLVGDIVGITWTASTLADGTYGYAFAVMDPAGNWSDVGGATTVTIDTVAPAAPTAPVLTTASDSGASATDGITNDSTPTFDVSASPYYHVYRNGTMVSQLYENAAQWTSATLADGAYGFTAVAIDLAGNVSSVGPAANVTIDTVAPMLSGAPALTAASDSGISSTDRITNVVNPVVDITPAAGIQPLVVATGYGTDAKLLIELDATTGVAVRTICTLPATYSQYPLGTAVGSEGVYVLSYSGGGFADGSKYQIYVVNFETGVIARTMSFRPTYDVSSLAYLNGSLYAARYGTNIIYRVDPDTGAISGSINISSGITYYSLTGMADRNRLALQTSSPTKISLVDPITGTVTSTLTYSGSSADGVGYANGLLIFGLPEVSGSTFHYKWINPDTGAVVYDRYLPTAHPMGIGGDGVVLLGPSATDMSMTLDGQPIAVDWANPNLQLPELADGMHTLVASRFDLAGNTTSRTLAFTIDTVAPAAPAAGPDLTDGSDSGFSATDNITHYTSPSFNITVGGNWRIFHDGVLVSPPYSSGTSWTSATLTDGVYSFVVGAADDAGNVALSPATVVTIDTIAPSAPPTPDLLESSDTGVSNTDNITREALPTFGLAVDEAYMSIAVSAASVRWYGPVVPAAATYTLATPLAEGRNTVMLSAVDLAGNSSPTSDLTVVLDTIAPRQPDAPDLVPTSDTGTCDNDNLTNDATPTFSLLPGPDYDPLFGMSSQPTIILELDLASGKPRRDITLTDVTANDKIRAIAVAPDRIYAVISAGSPVPLYILITVDVVSGASYAPPVTLSGLTGAVSGAAYFNGELLISTSTNICVVDPVAGNVTRTLPLSLPDGFMAVWGLTAAADTGKLYVLALQPGSYMFAVMEVDPLTGIGGTPMDISAAYAGSVACANGMLYVTRRNPDQSVYLAEIDPVTGSRTRTLPLDITLRYSVLIGGDGAAIPVIPEYYRVYRDGVAIGDYITPSSFTDDLTLEGSHTYTLAAIDAAGNESTLSESTVMKLDTTAPLSLALTINSGAVQRSMVREIDVAFSEPIALSGDALQVALRSGGVPADVDVNVTNPSGDGKHYHLTFSGAAIIGASLPDGMFKAMINAAGVSDLAGNPLAAGRTVRFHRLFGDVDGDRDVDRIDLAAMKSALNRPTNYVWWLDFNNDGIINNRDYLEFRKRLIKPLLL